VLTPAVLAAVRRARVNPKPYLLACALVANAASLLLPMSNPANLVVYGNHVPPLGSWLRIFILSSLAAILVTYFCLRFLSRDVLASGIESHQDRVLLHPAGRIALAGLVLASGVLLAASALRIQLGLPTCAVAVAALVAVSVKDHAVFQRTALKVSWSILPLVAGLFVLIESLNSAGLLQLIAGSFQWLANAPKLGAFFVASGGAALLSNAMNNLPVALAGGAVLKFAPQLSASVLIGVNLGPNLSVTGSLATILWLMALRREQVQITRWEFFKTGLVVMPAAWLVSILALWL
jgi:arsenical pump membrane protein